MVRFFQKNQTQSMDIAKTRLSLQKKSQKQYHQIYDSLGELTLLAERIEDIAMQRIRLQLNNENSSLFFSHN